MTISHPTRIDTLRPTRMGDNNGLYFGEDLDNVIYYNSDSGLSIEPTRDTGISYGYGLKLDSDLVFTTTAAKKGYMLGVFSDRTSAYAATGDSNDALIRASGNNYAACDSNYILRGLNISINQRSGGTLGRLEGGAIGAQNKSGGTAPIVIGLTVVPENYGTCATLFGGIDVLLKNEGAVATTEFGIRLRNENNSVADAIAAAIAITDTGANTGFDSLIETSPQSDADVNIVKLGFTGTPTFWWDESEDCFAMTKGLSFSGASLTQGIAGGLLEIGDYSTPMSFTLTDHVIAIQSVVQAENSIDKWLMAGYFKVQTDGSNAATLTNFCAVCPRIAVDQAVASAHGVQSHVTRSGDADVSGQFTAGSFKLDVGSGAQMSGSNYALQVIIDGSATKSSSNDTRVGYFALYASAKADAIIFIQAATGSTASEGLYIANHGTMTNAIQINSTGDGTVVNAFDALGTFSSYGIDLGDATCTTADIRLQNAMVIDNDKADRTMIGARIGVCDDASPADNAPTNGAVLYFDGTDLKAKNSAGATATLNNAAFS